MSLHADGDTLNLIAVTLFHDRLQPLGSRQISLALVPLVSLFPRHDRASREGLHNLVSGALQA